MIEQTKSYSKLIPPSNVDYPWRPHDWQLLCYYCSQPIYQTKPVAGYRQRTLHMMGKWLHTESDSRSCNPKSLRPDNEIDDPRCSCLTQTNTHQGICSAAGKPQYVATSMSDKEQELISIFGWKGDRVNQ